MLEEAKKNHEGRCRYSNAVWHKAIALPKIYSDIHVYVTLDRCLVGNCHAVRGHFWYQDIS